MGHLLVCWRAAAFDFLDPGFKVMLPPLFRILAVVWRGED